MVIFYFYLKFEHSPLQYDTLDLTYIANPIEVVRQV